MNAREALDRLIEKLEAREQRARANVEGRVQLLGSYDRGCATAYAIALEDARMLRELAADTTDDGGAK